MHQERRDTPQPLPRCARAQHPSGPCSLLYLKTFTQTPPFPPPLPTQGGVGAGLKILSGAAKAKVNGVPVAADFGLPGGEADINIASPALKGIKFP